MCFKSKKDPAQEAAETRKKEILEEERRKAREQLHFEMMKRKIQAEQPKIKDTPIKDRMGSAKKIRVYDAIVKHVYEFSTEPIDCRNLTVDEVQRIFIYVKGDYPNFFWMDWFNYDGRYLTVKFRCLKDGKVDIDQVYSKIAELQKAAEPFLRGITYDTKPYDAFLKIYRRLIITLDYDMAGLNQENRGNGADLSTDDNLRSLYSALVNHKVVCAGYAVALQYLLNQAGIVSAYVISESNGNECHAFNIVQIGNEKYFVDATWGDSLRLNTECDKDTILYNYCLVSTNQFMQTNDPTMHCPHKAFYPTLEHLVAQKYEYFNYHHATFTSCSEEQMVEMMQSALESYDKKDCGKIFCLAFRASNEAVRLQVHERLIEPGVFQALLKVAEKRMKPSQRGKVRLKDTFSFVYDDKVHTEHFFFKQ